MSINMEFGFPRELEIAKKERWPLLIPVGTMEYHGPHCALGCDSLISKRVAELVAERIDSVVMPTIWYGVTSYAVAGPEKNSIHVNCDTFEDYMYNILKSLIHGGWRNIYMIISHQYEDYNPMELACMKAGRKLIFEYLEETQGNGWWGRNDNQDFYSEFGEGASDNPWNWIHTVHGASERGEAICPIDHAGKAETSVLGFLSPEAVKIERLSDSDEWFIQSAAESSVELGERKVMASVEDLVEYIKSCK